MKQQILFIALVLSCLRPAKAVKITIIESQTYNAGHVMDQNWLSLAQSLGDTAALFPQATLDNNAFFSTTDILIVSSGVIPLPANRVAIILQYLQQGGRVYLQSEYLDSFDTDQAFQYLVNTLNGSFAWTVNVSGTLAPMNVLGSLGTTTKAISPLSYFWYGAAGSGCANVEPFLEYQGNYFGFVFCPPTAGVGKLITTTDQDWLRAGGLNEQNLMQNILTNLLDNSYICSSTIYTAPNLGPDTSLCMGDSITLHAGAGFAAYQWQNGSADSVFTVQNAGIYWVTVNTPCRTYTDSVSIAMNACAGPLAVFTSSDTTFCSESGKCINFFDHSLGNPTSWLWLFPGANPSSSTLQNPDSICYSTLGTYSVTLIVTNASSSDTLIVSPMITVGSAPAQPIITAVGGDTLVSSYGTSYQWYFNGSPISGATDSFYVAQQQGTYSVLISDGDGCSSLSAGFFITSQIELAGAEIRLYPNPVSKTLGVLGLEFAVGARVEIFNMVGKKLHSYQLQTPNSKLQTLLDVSGLPAGVYVVRISSISLAEQKVIYSKIVKE